MNYSSGTLDSATVLLAGSAEWLGPFGESLESQTGASSSATRTVDDAVDSVATDSVDCVVCADEFDGARRSLELVRAIRDESATLPVLLCPTGGSEAFASEAIRAGVTDYVPVDEPSTEAFDALLERTERAIRDARREGTRRDRARQFDAIFRDQRTATWVLDPDGTLVRVNETPIEHVDESVEALTGRPFWELPWWSDDESLQSDVRSVVEKARDGTYGNAVITQLTANDESRVVDLSARPVENAHGELVSIVVEGVDVTERVDLERDLRASEELHRVTLNNMTDTVLIADEDGEYTYVCPNVHFIFGYTAEEIRDLGTIDGLLGADLFDRDELAERGVLKNIECTATDSAGRERTLLVNVREVSIQGGTILYSCRDITKRKQREEALATLQETARDFLYAETFQEIAQQTVDDASSVLDVDASAIYLFDADENDLRPVAHTPAMEAAHGPLRTVHADGEDLTSYSFVEDEPLFFDDVRQSTRYQNRVSDLCSAAYVPLGNHGVLVAGSESVGAFDTVSREITDLLAATAEAALDRVARESRLREQERELQRRNDELASLDRINETIREIDQAVVQAETRSEIEHTVCERLTADDRFRFAWIGAADPAGETVEPRASAGADRSYLEQLDVPVSSRDAEPTGRTAATQEPVMITTVAERRREEAWRRHALTRDFLSVTSVPLAYGDASYGVLSVYADSPDAFDERARAVLAELGETVAAAIGALERKHALLTDAVTRVEFDVDDSEFVLSRLASDAACTLSYQGGVRQTEAGSDVFVTVEDGAVDDVVRAAGESPEIADVRRIGDGASGGVVRVRLTRPFLAIELADHGSVLRSLTADGSHTTLVADVPESVTVQRIADVLRETLDDVTLRSRRSVDGVTGERFPAQVHDRLTDRQREVLETAFYSGFFESPRECTGEEVADALGISPAAFYKHVRTVERTLFTTLFEDVGTTSSPARDSSVQL